MQERTTASPRRLKRLFVIIFAVASGVVLTASVVIGVVLWYLSRPQPPQPPKPWDTSTIVATYDHISTEGSDNTFVFYYVLENKAARDYRLEKGSSLTLMAQLERQQSLIAADDYITIDLPLFVPAGRRQRVAIHLKYKFSEPYPTNASDEQRKAYEEKLRKYLSDELSNLNGFSLFDNSNRYEIRFPRGW